MTCANCGKLMIEHILVKRGYPEPGTPYVNICPTATFAEATPTPQPGPRDKNEVRCPKCDYLLYDRDCPECGWSPAIGSPTPPGPVACGACFRWMLSWIWATNRASGVWRGGTIRIGKRDLSGRRRWCGVRERRREGRWHRD